MSEINTILELNNEIERLLNERELVKPGNKNVLIILPRKEGFLMVEWLIQNLPKEQADYLSYIIENDDEMLMVLAVASTTFKGLQLYVDLEATRIRLEEKRVNPNLH